MIEENGAGNSVGFFVCSFMIQKDHKKINKTQTKSCVGLELNNRYTRENTQQLKARPFIIITQKINSTAYNYSVSHKEVINKQAQQQTSWMS